MIELGNPPRFRKAGEFSHTSCAACEHFSNVGFCIKYQLPVEARELCDSYSSIHQFGKRQAANP